MVRRFRLPLEAVEEALAFYHQNQDVDRRGGGRDGRPTRPEVGAHGDLSGRRANDDDLIAHLSQAGTMELPDIVRAIRKLIAPGLPIADEVYVLNHWR